MRALKLVLFVVCLPIFVTMVAGVIDGLSGPRPKPSEKPSAAENLIPSPKDWKSERKLLKEGVDVTLGGFKVRDHVSRIYADALQMSEDPYIARNKHPGFAEYRSFLGKVLQVTGDGFVTPSELREIRDYAVEVNNALVRGDLAVAEWDKVKIK